MKPKLFNENYILIDDEDQVNHCKSIMIRQIFIDFADDVLKDTYLVQIQLIDDYNGNINHLISQSIKKHKWSKRF